MNFTAFFISLLWVIVRCLAPLEQRQLLTFDRDRFHPGFQARTAPDRVSGPQGNYLELGQSKTKKKENLLKVTNIERTVEQVAKLYIENLLVFELFSRFQNDFQCQKFAQISSKSLGIDINRLVSFLGLKFEPSSYNRGEFSLTQK